VNGKSQHPREDIQWRLNLTENQWPFATILGCSDSRVPVELIFDQGFGDLFVIRIAGNVVGEIELASIEFAVKNLKTPLILVLGHENCGALTAALSPVENREKGWDVVRKLLTHIDPALQDIDPSLSIDQKIRIGVEANVRWSVQQLKSSLDLKQKINENKLIVAGGVYELESGEVKMFL
jgi:carbonic anhydrase